MTTIEILTQLEQFGNPSTKKIFLNHGAQEPLFGVKVQDLKTIQKKIKKDYQLSLELFETGNADAMYLAGLIADEQKMTKEDLRKWATRANWYMINEYAVAWVIAESSHGFDLALELIESDQENVASTGWAALSSLVGMMPDNELNIPLLRNLLSRVEHEVHQAKNRVRYTMNGFVIAVGGSVKELTQKAQEVGANIGKVHVNVGNTACKVPLATEYIQKIMDRGSLGKKRKTARC